MIIPSYPVVGQALDALWGRQVVDALRALRIVCGRGLRKTADGSGGQVIEALEASFQSKAAYDYSRFSFGFVISGETVTIKSGEVTWGESVFGIGDTDFSVSEDLSYIGIQVDYSGAQLISPTTDVNECRTSGGVKRTWLFRFNWIPPAEGSPEGSTGTVMLNRIGKPLGNWDLGAEYAPPLQ